MINMTDAEALAEIAALERQLEHGMTFTPWADNPLGETPQEFLRYLRRIDGLNRSRGYY